MKNKYFYRSRISEAKFREIVRHFAMDINASKTALLCGVNRNTVNSIYSKIRLKIIEYTLTSIQDYGEFEVDESYFGARRVRGKRGRGAAGKTPVFGLLKRDGKVWVNVIENCSKSELMPIIEGKVLEGSTIYSDGWKAYDGLILNGYEHYRVYHSHNEFARGKSHINGIESFWSFAKRRLAKFNGLSDETFHIHLKECEFRWNNKDSNLYKILLKLLRDSPLK